MIPRTEANVQRAARAIAGVLYGTEDRWPSVADAALAAIIAVCLTTARQLPGDLLQAPQRDR